ncbi:MAG: hypothetical protein M3378_05150 [Actinomycetota bacterium]|nr:hypothetical protein [Actinomycetota bacterium]
MAITMERSSTATLPAQAATQRKPWRLITASALVGIALAMLWWSNFVDGTVGEGLTSQVFGEEAEEVALTSGLAAAAFALVTGLAGTLTACNIAVFGALAPMMGQQQSTGARLATVVKPVAWMTGAAMATAGTYGAIGVYIDHWVPTLSDTTYGEDLSARRLQAAIVFSAIGVILIWRALAALGLVRHPLQRFVDRHPRTDMVMMGVLVGAFVIGRPFGLFRHLYEYAGDTNNPLIGFSTFALQALGNILIVALVFVAIALFSKGRVERFMTATPTRLASFTASSLLIAGTFFIVYWGLKSGSRLGWYGWPTLPWQT